MTPRAVENRHVTVDNSGVFARYSPDCEVSELPSTIVYFDR